MRPLPRLLGGTQLTLSTGTAQDLVIGGTAGTLTKLGLTAATTARGGGTTALGGQTLTIGATGNGTATNITFGDGTGGTVKSLNDLNATLAANNLQATIDSDRQDHHHHHQRCGFRDDRYGCRYRRRRAARPSTASTA